MAVAEPAMMAPAEDLEATLIRKLDDLKETISKKPALPPWLIPLVMWSIIQLVGSIWWAATMQAKLDFVILKLNDAEQRVNVLEMRANKNDTDFGERVRSKVRETIDDLDLIRVRRKDE